MQNRRVVSWPYQNSQVHTGATPQIASHCQVNMEQTQLERNVATQDDTQQTNKKKQQTETKHTRTEEQFAQSIAARASQAHK